MKVLLIFMLTLFTISAQLFNKASKSGLAPFKLFHKEVFDPEQKKTISEIQVSVNYNTIVFDRISKDHYQADYDVSIKLLKSDETFYSSDFKTESIVLKDFDQTNLNSRTSVTKFRYALPSDNFIAIVYIEDKRSKKRFENKISFAPTKQTQSFTISDLKFYEIDHKTEEKKLNESQIFTDRDGKLLIKYQVNFTEPTDSIYYRIYMTSHTSLRRIYYNTVKAATKRNKSEVEFFFDKSFFTEASYKLTVEAIVDTNSVKKETNFSFVWYKTPNTMTEMKTALKQMHYIADGDSVDYYIELNDIEKAKRYFMSVWEGMTERKSEQEIVSLMSEYFNRVNYSNTHFGKYRKPGEGWKTDRGRILIKFGKPDEVQRFPFQSNSRPYMIWHYYQEKKYFIFIETIHNEYKLSDNTRQFEYQ